MRKPLADVTDKDIHEATCIVLCNLGHSQSLPVAGKIASPTLLAASGAAIKSQTLFVVVCSEGELGDALARLKPLRNDMHELSETAQRAFAAELACSTRGSNRPLRGRWRDRRASA